MIVIEPKATVLDKEGMTAYEFIEKIGRTCYKSESKITEGSDVKFIKGLMTRKHFSVLEHWWEHFIINAYDYWELNYFMVRFPERFKYFSISETNNGDFLVSGSLRAFKELFEWNIEITRNRGNLIGRFEQRLQVIYPEVFGDRVRNDFIVLPVLVTEEELYSFCLDNSSQMRHITHTVRFICDRGVSHELVRHRPWAVSQESTRYVNYGHEGDIIVIKPLFYKENSPQYEEWKSACKNAEKSYMSLLAGGSSPQEARSVLPNSLKTEIVMTGTEEQWQHLVNLRYHGTTGKPHPQMEQLVGNVYEYIKNVSKARVI